MRKEMYWCHMANEVYSSAVNYRSHAKNRPHDKQQLHLELFFLEGQLEPTDMYILGPLSKTK